MKIRITLIAHNGDFLILRGSPDRIDKCLSEGWVIGPGAIILCEVDDEVFGFHDELLSWEKFLSETEQVGCEWIAYKAYLEWCSMSFTVWNWMVDPTYLGVSAYKKAEMVFHIEHNETMLKNLGNPVYN